MPERNVDRHTEAAMNESVSAKPNPLGRWMNLLYEEIRSNASLQMKNERRGHSFQTTDLVHEVYLRLAQLKNIDWQDQGQVLRAAVGSMRRVLIDRARYSSSQKRDHRRRQLVEMNQIKSKNDESANFDKLIELDDAIEKLRNVDPALFEVVELKIYGGQELANIAKALDISVSTVKRRWALAKAWLYRELMPEG